MKYRGNEEHTERQRAREQVVERERERISEAGRIEERRRVDPQRGAKDIQLPAISGSRLARGRVRELMPFLTATARDCGRDCGHGHSWILPPPAVNRARITRETSNCRKTLLIVDRGAYKWHYMVINAHFRERARRGHKVPLTTHNAIALCDNGEYHRVLSTS